MGSGLTPKIFKKFNENYRKTMMACSCGLIIWLAACMFHYTNEAVKTDTLNDD